jgi:hypothetical protein
MVAVARPRPRGVPKNPHCVSATREVSALGSPSQRSTRVVVPATEFGVASDCSLISESVQEIRA